MSAIRTILSGAVLLVLVAALLPTANAQTGIVETRLELVPEHFPKAYETDGTTEGPGLPAGDSTSGFVNLNFCYQRGAFNPDTNSAFKFTLSLTAPEWVAVSAPADAVVEFTPKTGPHTGDTEMCDKVHGWEIKPLITPMAPNGTMGDITYNVAVEGPDAIGTYKKPAAPPAAIAKIRVAAPGDDPLANLTGPGAGDDDPDAPANNEGPAPVAPLVVVLALVSLAALRRRR